MLGWSLGYGSEAEVKRFRASINRVLVAIVVAMAMAACGSDSGPSAGQPGDSNNEQSRPDPLVGTWTRLTKCAELVQAFKQAGLENLIAEFVAGNAFVPGVRRPNQFADPSDPCKGSVPHEHSHFFGEYGGFGSLDWKDQQVDDGTLQNHR